MLHALVIPSGIASLFEIEWPMPYEDSIALANSQSRDTKVAD